MYPKTDQRVFAAQLIVCTVLGTASFVAFCCFRARWPRFYAVRTLRKSGLRALPPGLFHWIKALYAISDDEILRGCGLDAFVYLGFFRMAIRIFGVCTVLAITVISPIRLYYTGQYDKDGVLRSIRWRGEDPDPDPEMAPYLWMYPVFTYIFTLLTLFFLFQQTQTVVSTRQRYLGAQNSITDRTISLHGIPTGLSNALALQRLLEDLGIGRVRDVKLCYDWSALRALFARRARLTRALEEAYAAYLGLHVDLDSGIPAVMLAEIDAKIERMREANEFRLGGCAFVTMDSVASAQMAAQAVLDPRAYNLIARLAPAPTDVKWENLCVPPGQKFVRRYLITFLIAILSVALFFPVAYLSTLINVKTISRFWPALGKAISDSKWATTFVTGILPPYLFTLMNVCVPYFYAYLSTLQGYRSKGDVELSTIAKNFFYIFFNLFLVFTLAGTASNYWSLLSDTTQIAYQLAQSIKKMSLFYANLILLQGVGMFPFRLLQAGDIFLFNANRLFRCSTPRDYRDVYYKPPVFDFGLLLPQPMLILIITLIYSVILTKIVASGLAYFVLGYFTYKYQLMYSMVHTQHSTGKVWPLIFRRVCLGLVLFQLTMVGTLALEKAFVLAGIVIPLVVLTFIAVYSFQTHYLPLSSFIALRSIQDGHFSVVGDMLAGESSSSSVDGEAAVSKQSRIRKRRSTVDEERDQFLDYTYPYLVDHLDGPWLGFEGDYVTTINYHSRDGDGDFDTITKKKHMVSEWE
ncbi:hypothetical protein BABINDRAFT_170398 [Babjeviella inositovora NRRL Y-12698]|uniref:CSC1/OSCA1-like 7TM region domain-containing protein n=1 Tax=Babjeviella inositovora NRRL Y-12698 TaxID=984486 RepID=A0A1E3QVN0_9ASCO|nr:uncharacterized protein BABINDRAFT_170398 [Babjeviella inositovora NRRL Y-12698]ODQ81711.1 hypothetical protein BABINDRAFT_170398 [Babjeviella inositovora NRRL Y-12698]